MFYIAWILAMAWKQPCCTFDFANTLTCVRTFCSDQAAVVGEFPSSCNVKLPVAIVATACTPSQFLRWAGRVSFWATILRGHVRRDLPYVTMGDDVRESPSEMGRAGRWVTTFVDSRERRFCANHISCRMAGLSGRHRPS